MATIKLNPIITDIRNRMGNNVFSKWKGINYVRGYAAPTNRKTPEQAEVRGAFKGLVAAWKALGEGAKRSWAAFAAGRNMTGYNAFIGVNFENMMNDLALIISHPMEEEPLTGFAASEGAAPGEVACTFAAPLAEGKELTLFSRKRNAGFGAAMARHELGAAASPAVITGLEAGAEYRLYAVVSDGPYGAATKVSESVWAEAKAKA